jgi:hypothetical protein
MTKGLQSWMVLAMAGAIAAGLTLWRMALLPLPRVELPAMVAPDTSTEQRAEPAEPAEPAIRHPVHVSAAPALSAAGLARALADVVGRDAMAALIEVDDFPRRFAATIDNLGRPHAPRLIWPVAPAADRFQVDETAGGPVIGVENAARYAPYVMLAVALDARRAVDLYVRMYPMLQAAYEELGYPDRYFNDRLIAVLDELLATPYVEQPVKLQLVEVKGPVPSLRPWVRYEFEDPALESLASGQKVLLRIGRENQRVLKGKLAEIREELVARTPRR